jgi:hypothetical protein
MPESKFELGTSLMWITRAVWLYWVARSFRILVLPLRPQLVFASQSCRSLAMFPNWRGFWASNSIFVVNFVTDQLPVFVTQVIFCLQINCLHEEQYLLGHAPRSPVEVNWRFGDIYRLHLHCSAFPLLHAGFLPKFVTTLMMEVICSSETSVDFHRTSWRYMPEGKTFHSRRCENLKSHSPFNMWIVR